MKLFQRRTALILIFALILQVMTSAFVFADESYSETSGPEETEIQKPEEADSEDLTDSAEADIASDSADNKVNDSEGQSSDTVTDKNQPKKNEQLSFDTEHNTLQGEQSPDSDQDDEEEEPLNGWVTEGGKKYYYIDGVKQTGMKHIGKYWYFFKTSGAMKTGWLTLNGKRYFFHLSSGRRFRGKKIMKRKVYYFRKSGVMVKGWLKSKGKKYYHNPKNGRRIFGSRKIKKYYYYFRPKSGIMKKGWLKLNGKKYYYDKKGHKRFGVQKIGRKTFYLNRTTGAKMPKGSYYLYNKIWSKSSRTNWLIYVSKGGRWVNVFKGKKNNWTIVKRCRCSIGAPGTPTPSGTFRVTCKVYHFGESKGYTCWYATGFIGSAYLMHSVVCYSGTKTPSDGRLGMAISHGCIRMKIGNAKWIYDHVPGGTTVYIS